MTTTNSDASSSLSLSSSVSATEKKANQPNEVNILTEQGVGFYKCVKCSQVLYASGDKKINTKTWPGFHKAIDKATIEVDDPQKNDHDSNNNLFLSDRKEIKCSTCFAHLGHHLITPTHSRHPEKDKKYQSHHCVDSLAIRFERLDPSMWRRYVGTLPYARDRNGQLWFLVGKEVEIQDWLPSGSWSDWGGAQERTEVEEEKENSSSLPVSFLPAKSIEKKMAGATNRDTSATTNNTADTLPVNKNEAEPKTPLQESADPKKGKVLSLVVYGEHPVDTGAREFYEESMGIFGCQSTIKQLLLKFAQEHHLVEAKVTEYLLPIAWEPQLPERYNNIFRYLTACTTAHPTLKGLRIIPSCPKGFGEKTQMGWVRYETLLKVCGLTNKTPTVGSDSSIPDAPPFFEEEVVEEVSSDAVFRPSFLKSFAQLHQKNVFDSLKKLKT